MDNLLRNGAGCARCSLGRSRELQPRRLEDDVLSVRRFKTQAVDKTSASPLGGWYGDKVGRLFDINPTTESSHREHELEKLRVRSDGHPGSKQSGNGLVCYSCHCSAHFKIKSCSFSVRLSLLSPKGFTTNRQETNSNDKLDKPTSWKYGTREIPPVATKSRPKLPHL